VKLDDLWLFFFEEILVRLSLQEALFPEHQNERREKIQYLKQKKLQYMMT